MGLGMAIFDFFRRKQQPPLDRYAGKPLLKLVEAFVLDAIGELPAAQRTTLEQMTEKLQEVYKSTSPWQGIVVEVMHWDSDIASSIQGLWKRNQAIACSSGVTLSPTDFVVMFVEANVAHT